MVSNSEIKPICKSVSTKLAEKSIIKYELVNECLFLNSADFVRETIQ